MTYDNELLLIDGESHTTVLCKMRSAGQREFSVGLQEGYRPELEFIIHDFEYSGEKEVRFQGEPYGVVRSQVFTGSDEMLLVCERKIGLYSGD